MPGHSFEVDDLEPLSLTCSSLKQMPVKAYKIKPTKKKTKKTKPKKPSKKPNQKSILWDIFDSSQSAVNKKVTTLSD